MARLKNLGQRIDRQTKYWGFACVVMAALVLVLAPPPLSGSCPDPETPCPGTETCCNGVCCAGTCLTKSDETKICCPAGQVLCNDVCCAGTCLTKSDETKICCPTGQYLCADACCASPACCNNTTCGFNCSTTGGANDTCKTCADAAGVADMLCKMCPDYSGAPNKNCFQCDTDNNTKNDACWSCRSTTGGLLDNCGADTNGDGIYDCCRRVVTTYAQLAACPTVKPNPYTTATGVGCTGGVNNPCGAGGTSFLACCQAHDVGYGTCNSSKAAVDTAFLNCMLAVCGPANPSCGFFTNCDYYAYAYYDAVYVGGQSYWEDGQLADCYCCHGTG